MLVRWAPGGANTVRMGDALVIVPGRLPLDQGAAQWTSCQASRAGTSTQLDAHGHDSQARSVWDLI